MAKGAAAGKQSQGSGSGDQGEQGAGALSISGGVARYIKLKLVIAIVCVFSCIQWLLIVILIPWGCRRVSESNECIPPAGFFFGKSSHAVENLLTQQGSPGWLRHSQLDCKVANTPASLACAGHKTGTDISRIVSGIAAASHTWVNHGRREYVKLWWKPEQMRGFVWLDKEIEGGKWGSEYPPFKVSQDTANFTYTNARGRRDALRITQIVSESFRLDLPNVDWFVMADDDTVFITENLVHILSKYDHTKPFYVGYASESHRDNIIFSYDMAFGGAGYAISYSLAKELAKTQDSCLERYPHFLGGDDRIYACVAELGVPLTKEPGLHQLDIRRDAFGILAAHPITPLVSLHHLDILPIIFPKTTTKSFTQVEAVKYLLDAAAADPGSILQQSICYDRKQDWSISVTWGYVVQVHKGFISPLKLQRPARTFLSWYHENEQGTFSLNTREVAMEVCKTPTRFFLEAIQGPTAELEGLMEGIFVKEEDPEQSQCNEELMPLSVVKKIHVLKEPMDPSYYQSPRMSCC